MLKKLVVGTLLLTGIVISSVAPSYAGQHKDHNYKPQDEKITDKDGYKDDGYRYKDGKYGSETKKSYDRKGPKNDSWDNKNKYQSDDYEYDMNDPRNRGYEKVDESEVKNSYKKNGYNKYPGQTPVIIIPAIKVPVMVTPPWNPNPDAQYDYSGGKYRTDREKIERKIKKLERKLDRYDSDRSGYKGGYDRYDYDRKGGYDSNNHRYGYGDYQKPYPTYGDDMKKINQNPIPVIEVKPHVQDIKKNPEIKKPEVKKPEVKLNHKTAPTPVKVNPAKKPCK
jgi:hypothetical protein